MTPQEKAEELVNSFLYLQIDNYGIDYAKLCAINSANEVIKVLDEISIGESGTTKIDYGQSYWNEVKEQINKL